MKNGVKSKLNRRNFIKTAFWIGISANLLAACKKASNRLFLKLTGTNHILGHKLRFPDFPKVSEEQEIQILILGAGISGLSAAYQLQKSDTADFMILEMENQIGGNSRSGKNDYSPYPLGAHYLPIPNASNKEIYEFLHACNIVTGWDPDGSPVFDEEQLSFAPETRLFINNFWQDGIVPHYGLTQSDELEIARFFKEMESFSQLKGSDLLFVFQIPMQQASQSHEYAFLDQIGMEKWLIEHNYTSKYLHNHVDYCCRDDFGLGIKQCSAFAGIHYFASRKHDFHKYRDQVLTWQEGNGRLVNHLSKYSENKVKTGMLVKKIQLDGNKVITEVFDSKNKKSIRIRSDYVINSLPQFVNQYLMSDRKQDTKAFQYAPWIVATITLESFPFADGAPLAWDNVIYNGKGLGYIYDQHQSLSQFSSPFVISYYHCLNGENLAEQRKFLLEQPETYWKDFIIADLSKAHFGIEKEIRSIEIFRHGHGMISPVPGFISGEERKKMSLPIANKIFFAHSDLSGMSIFEEAFYQGITAAKAISKIKN